jgi:hypothetical protein
MNCIESMNAMSAALDTRVENLAALLYLICPRLPLPSLLHNTLRSGCFNVEAIPSVLSRENQVCSVLFLNAVLSYRHDAEQTSQLEIQ